MAGTETTSTIRHAKAVLPARDLRRRNADGVTNGRSAWGVGPNFQQSLPIKRVVLYSNGVAYIERRGVVSNHAEISLSFKQSQVDDVLKSMIVLDLGKGRIGAVSYNSSAPASARMAEIPFGISASTDGHNGGLAGVLSQLQGARVVVTTATRVVTGSIITVEARSSLPDTSKAPIISHRLVIATDNGELSGFDLAEVRSVRLADEGARRDLTEFAHAAASARRRDAKTIVVTSDGVGQREMLVSYIIAAPIWKTTYRVVLDSTGKPFFQGWAIVDNISEEDWNGIELALVSGTPISFIQPIQNPVYRYRPVIPFSEDLNLKPQVYEPGEGGGDGGSLSGTITDPVGSAVPRASVTVTNTNTNQTFQLTTDDDGKYRASNLTAGRYTINAQASGFKNATITDLNVAGGVGTHFNFNLEVGSVSEVVNITAGSAEVNSTSSSISALPIVGADLVPKVSRVPRISLSNVITGGQSGVDAETTVSEIGDLFEYRIDQPVTVPRDRSALIPILQARMEGERVSIFSARESCTESTGEASVGCSRPMSGLLLKNTSPLTLEDGSLTVVDGDAYLGEALMERLKPSEERLISFALDLGTLVNVREVEERSPTFLVKAVNGVIEAHYYNTRKKIYGFVNQTPHARTIYLEHPIEEDWELTADTLKPETTTKKHYRFRVKLEPHQKLELPVKEREEMMETYALANFTRSELDLFVIRRYVDESTRIVLERLIDLKGRVVAADKQLAELAKEAEEIAKDQGRLRENIQALTSTSEAKQLIARYVTKANDQETRLEEIEKSRRSMIEERARLQMELDSAIRSLNLDRKL
ncbi:MAG: carboxypeptidase regulatory-like domain-containing protein [Pyrinomonadaceae bacterium]